MQFTETELAKLIETVETEFTKELNKAEQAYKATASLSKAEDEKKEKPSNDKPAEDKDAASKEAAPKDESSEAPAAAAPAAAAPAQDENAAPAPAAAAAPAQDGADHCDYDDEDHEHMHKMYASMSKGELRAHHDSIRKALDAHSAAPAAQAAPAAPAAPAQAPISKSEIKDENPVLNSKATAGGNDTNTAYNENSGGAVSKTSEPKGSPGAKSPASKAEGVQMEKSEKTEVELLKSELEAEKAKGADLKKNFDTVSEFLTKFVTKIQAPKGKAITEVAAIQKSEGAESEVSLTKSEITQVLMKKSQDPSLSKSDRDAINAYYLNGANFNTISHLLK